MESRDQVAEHVRKLIIGMMDADPDKVLDGARFVEDLRADSLDYVELLMAAEERFDIEIADDEAEKVSTVKDAIDLVCAKLQVAA